MNSPEGANAIAAGLAGATGGSQERDREGAIPKHHLFLLPIIPVVTENIATVL
jgi:hypothetical protein